MGFVILGLGVNLMKASSLGAGAWDTVTINVRDFLNMNLGLSWVTLGMISFVVSSVLMLIVLSYRKKPRFLLMIFPIIFVAVSIDFWNIVIFKDSIAVLFQYQIIFYLLGTLLLPLGLTSIVKSSYPAFVFDELMLMLVKILKAKKITFVRLGIEFTGILLGSIFGYFSHFQLDGTLGAVNIGSFILAFTLSPIMAFYFKILKVQRKD